MGTTANALPASASLAVERTRLAHERTLLAWVRTATSLISFGFTLYKFFQYLQQRDPNFAATHRFTAREFAMIMISTGLIALVIATVQHRQDVVRMRTIYPEVPYSFATILAALLSGLGLIALVAVILRQ